MLTKIEYINFVTIIEYLTNLKIIEIMRKKVLYLVPLTLLGLAFNANAQYCTGGGPTSTIDSNVEQVDITGEATTAISHTGCPGVAGVEDLTGQLVELQAGNTYNIDVTFGTCGGNYGGAGEVWIDYDQDDTFDPGESIGTSSGTPGTAPWDAPVTFNFTVPTGAINGVTRMRVMQREGGTNPLDPCGSYTYGSVMDFSVEVTGGVTTTCPDPTNLLVSNITQNNVDFTWTDGGSGVAWDIEWGTPGFTPGTGSEIGSINGTTNTTENISALTAGTVYEIYVRADCGGDQSNWISIEFATECDPANQCTYTFNMTDSWGDGWNGNTMDVIQGGVVIETLEMLNGAGPEPVVVTVCNGLPIELFWNAGGSFAGEVGVEIVDGDGVSLYNKPPGTGTQNSSLYTGTVSCPTCPGPNDLDASNIAQTTADLSWTAGGSETVWNVEWGTPGFVPGTAAAIGDSIGANNMVLSVSGLTASTDYEFYVQADCGAGDESVWVGPFMFTTECAVFPVPFLESFSSGAEPNCWSSYSKDGSTVANANWKFTGSAGYGASTNGGKPGGTFAWVDGSTPDDTSAVLLSPLIDLTGLTTPTLSFEIFSDNTNYPGDNMEFTVEVDNGIDTTLITTYAADSSEWVLKQFDLSAYNGQTIRLMFTVDQTTTTNSAYYNDILLDEVAICEGEDPSFTYSANELCELETSYLPNITGVTGGTFEGTAGLAIDATTGEIDPSSTALGIYTVTYTTSLSSCRGTETFEVEIVDVEDASFDYATNEVCSNDAVEMPTITGIQGGSFSAGVGLDIDGTTGAIDPSVSNAGSYTVEYTSSTTACASTEQFTFEVIEAEDASFDYGGTEFCINYVDVVPTIAGTSGGTFSAEPGLAINALTGQVGAEATTPGTYWIYYTTPGANNCPATDSVQITVDECLGLNEQAMNEIQLFPNPANNVVNYVIPEMAGQVEIKMMDATGKVVYVNSVEASSNKREINVADFENGMYMISFKNKDKVTTKRIVISR